MSIFKRIHGITLEEKDLRFVLGLVILTLGLILCGIWTGCHSQTSVESRTVGEGSDETSRHIDLLKKVATIGQQDPEKPQKEFRFFKNLMGTQFNIQLIGYDRLTAQAAARAAFNEVGRVERLVSSWRVNSEIGQLNRASLNTPVQVSLDTAWLLCQSRAISTQTRGAFDITWAALKGLWDFRHGRIPDHALLQRRLLSVGMDYVRLTLKMPSPSKRLVRPLQPGNVGSTQQSLKPFDQDPCPQLLSVALPPSWTQFSEDPPPEWGQVWSAMLTKKNVQVDLGGIAKGFGVDQAAVVLKRLGYEDFLIDGGGDLLAHGRAFGGVPWSVGIAHPRMKKNWGKVWIPSGWAVVTSGDYERFFMNNEVRYHHIIDLRTGYPARGCVAVTVIAKSAMVADAYATGLFVLGPRDGLALAESLPDLEALFFTPTGEVVTTQGAQVFSYELKDRWYH